MVITNDQLREMTTHGSKNFPIQYYLDDINHYPDRRINCHWHDEIEFAVIQEGEANYQIGDQTVVLHKGEGIFINSGIIHGYEAENHTLVPNIVFSPELIAGGNQTVYQKYIQPIQNSQISYLYLSSRVSWQEDILMSLNHIFSTCNSEDETRELDIQIAITSIWRQVFLHQDSCSSSPHTATYITTQTRLRLMIEYIANHFMEKIRLEDIAFAAKVSKSEALRCFKEGAATSPVDYLIQFRLKQGRKMLLTTKRRVTDIAGTVGFDNVGYFDRLFKKAYGVTPNQLRRHAIEQGLALLHHRAEKRTRGLG
ncbi:AraC family transcriptional regulator [Paenibacillus riograndensis]|uniref:HTH araC/xylS-type domain-containing protein n=3 Tax=Paenibacillus riograndensis TaxID=483937 RepID=A0A0E4HD56_9BACL|nr:AraC family transcriptional regulator [Paenibacillus riograndensis]KWX86830.1 hypothetical protein AMQ83_16685 [Paenibacillus riograndensis]CQR55034.1 hypothetical protein PRIO_2630 [Paenibacillus riograndensis SBR5]